jgi:hypothetical protein
MNIRDTEGAPASFRTSLFDKTGVHGLQGLLMDNNWEATAGVEAIDYNIDERINMINNLGERALATKFALTNSLEVPLYIITSRNQEKLSDLTFNLYKVLYDGAVAVTQGKTLSPEGFVKFWAELKGTTSTKGLPDADVRIEDSNVDNVIREANLEWGGNVDGILMNDDREVRAIIECRKTTKSNLENYDPNDYFHYRGGDYNTWRPLYNISTELEVPLVLLTFKRGENRCGCTYIDDMSRSHGLTYRNGTTPDENLLDQGQAVKELQNLK